MHFSDYQKSLQIMQDIRIKYQQSLELLCGDLLNMSKHSIFSNAEMNNLMSGFYYQAMTQPENWINMQTKFAEQLSNLIYTTITDAKNNAMQGAQGSKVLDKRFREEEWNDNAYFNFIKQFYLMSSEIWNEYIKQTTKGLASADLVNFINKQIVNALCPSNFIFTNPAVIKASLEQNGENISRGLDNLLNDLKKYNDYISISTVSSASFEVGKNIACTKGKVVYKNELMELLCFESKNKVHKTPIYIVPAWINKYYILDLSPHNSFVKWLVDNNFQVFMVSWVNPDASYKDVSFDDYCIKGIVEPCLFIKEELKIEELNAVGYCLGGTALSMTLSYMNAQKINIFKTATFFTSLMDFANPGELGMFTSENMIQIIEKEMDEVGYLDGRYLSSIFSILKANELIWHFIIHNYLLGKSPEAFDILFWNSDATNLPATMHSYYLRNMYLHNNLKISNKMFIKDVNISLENITIPTFCLAAKEDHIAPAAAVFASHKLLNRSNSHFCLTASGHIAGIVNPPNQSKYSYWINNNNIEDYATWYESATKCSGSWWPHFLEWINQNSPSVLEDSKYESFPSVEAAPGSYVKRQL
jgi:polyhydroxyalkanoate synthase